MNSPSPSPSPSPWLDDFRAETSPVILEPFFLCLAEAIATVESAAGRHPIAGPEGRNEIGYKAVPGHPAAAAGTREADAAGRLLPATAEFRLFRDRAEQARALLYLLRSSHYYDTARLLFILAFYSAYAPGRTDGIRDLLQVFNRIAATGAHEGVRPLCLIPNKSSECELQLVHSHLEAPDPDTLALNHNAARAAVRLFAELTAE